MSDARRIRRVFVVDDEPTIASTLEMILCSWGFDAISFSNPREALSATRSAAPDLLISDVTMPQLSGIELAIQVKECSPNCKVLLITGQVSKLGDEHPFEVLSKPVPPPELLRKIESLTEDAPPRPSVNRVGHKDIYHRRSA